MGLGEEVDTISSVFRALPGSGSPIHCEGTSTVAGEHGCQHCLPLSRALSSSQAGLLVVGRV